jgi:hypothetical protein
MMVYEQARNMYSEWINWRQTVDQVGSITAYIEMLHGQQNTQFNNRAIYMLQKSAPLYPRPSVLVTNIGAYKHSVTDRQTDRRISQFLHRYRSNVLRTLQWDVCVDSRPSTSKQMKASIFQTSLPVVFTCGLSLKMTSCVAAFFFKPPWHYTESTWLTHTSIHEKQWSALTKQIQ